MTKLNTILENIVRTLWVVLAFGIIAFPIHCFFLFLGIHITFFDTFLLVALTVIGVSIIFHEQISNFIDNLLKDSEDDEE